MTETIQLLCELFDILDKMEETDDGHAFHPTTINSCRALDAQRLGVILPRLKELCQLSPKADELTSTGNDPKLQTS